MPNAKVLEQKKAIVAELAQKMQDAKSGVLVDYKGISVAADTKLRKEMREAGVEYGVVKNTLTRFAANQVGWNELDPVLNGTTSLAMSMTDPVLPAKILNDFIKKNKNVIRIKAGFVEGKLIDEAGVVALAELPSREVLVAKVLGGFNAPITGFVGVLNANLRGLVVALNAVAEKKAAAGE